MRTFVLRSVVPGALATTLVAIGAFGVGWLPLDTSLLSWPVVDAMRSTLIGSIVCKASVIVGVALLLQSWLLLGHDVLRGRVPQPSRLWLALAAWCAPIVLAPPLFSRDVYSYFAQGKLMAAGLDPYTNGSASIPGWFPAGVDPMWAEAPTPYGQVYLLLERGVAEFAGTKPYTGAMTFRFLAVVGVALMAWGVPKLARAGGIPPAKALWLGVMNPLVIMHFISGCHNDSLMIGMIVAGLAVAACHHRILGVVIVVLGSSVKPIGLIALPFVGLIWAGRAATVRRRWLCWAGTAGIALVILGLLAVTTRTGFGWISALGTPGAVETWLSPPTAIGMILGAGIDLLGLHVANTVIAICRGLGTLASAVFLVWLCLKPEGRTPVRGAALGLLAIVVLGPVVQPWYLLWSIPLFAASGLSRIEFRVAIVGITGLSLWGLVTSSATQDALLRVPDGVALLVVAAVIVLVLAVSPQERRLLLGEGRSFALEPETVEALARRQELLVVRAPSPGVTPSGP